MTDPTTAFGPPAARGDFPLAARGEFPLPRAVVLATVATGLAGMVWLTGLTAATPQASTDDARRPAREVAVPFAPATGATRAGTSVPDASAVFAGREAVVEEPVSPY